jgi:hypothetical protein
MAPGYLAFAGRANWVDQLGVMDAAWGSGDTVVPVPRIRVPHLIAWRCERCRLVLADYGAGAQFTPP